MAEITAAMVKELREKTDAPMMECKKALAEAEGDMAKAEEILRVKLGNKASKAASRVAAEGVVAIDIDSAGKIGAIVEVNSRPTSSRRTRNLCVRRRTSRSSSQRISRPTCRRCRRCRWEASTVEAMRTALIGKIGENMSIRRFARVKRRAAWPVTSTVASRSACWSTWSRRDEPILRKDLAMHIAASKPKSIDASGVPAELRRDRTPDCRRKGAPRKWQAGSECSNKIASRARCRSICAK